MSQLFSCPSSVERGLSRSIARLLDRDWAHPSFHLVEDIFLNLQELGKNGCLKIKLPGGAEDLSNRYSVMQILQKA